MVSVIRCLLLLVELFLIGLELGDSRLVILSLLSLALFLFVINLWIGFLFCFFFVNRALEELDNSDFQGRLLHVLPAKEKSSSDQQG